MFSTEIMTADEFADRRPGLPEGGRWHELHAGRAVLLEAPDDSYGTIVMNLSREIAKWLHSSSKPARGYACHEVGLHVKKNPDTVYVPAISYFDGGAMFEQTDQVIATKVPRLVVDIASSNDRRRAMRERTIACMALGVELIWIPDPFKQEIQVIQKNGPTLALGNRQVLEGSRVLPGFSVEVSTIFAQPSWWTSPAIRRQVPEAEIDSSRGTAPEGD